MLWNEDLSFLDVQINIDMVGEGRNVICTEKPCFVPHIFSVIVWIFSKQAQKG